LPASNNGAYFDNDKNTNPSNLSKSCAANNEAIKENTHSKTQTNETKHNNVWLQLATSTIRNQET